MRGPGGEVPRRLEVPAVPGAVRGLAGDVAVGAVEAGEDEAQDVDAVGRQPAESAVPVTTRLGVAGADRSSARRQHGAAKLVAPVPEEVEKGDLGSLDRTHLDGAVLIELGRRAPRDALWRRRGRERRAAGRGEGGRGRGGPLRILASGGRHRRGRQRRQRHPQSESGSRRAAGGAGGDAVHGGGAYRNSPPSPVPGAVPA